MRICHFLVLWSSLFFVGSGFCSAFSLAEADRLYEAGTNREEIGRIAPLILEAMPSSTGQDEWSWRLARIDYRLGVLAGENEKKRYFSRCIERAQLAIKANAGSGPGYFFKGLCTGKKGEMEGIWKSLEIIDPFKKAMETALKRDPEFDQGGPPRALAKLYLELPFFLGGSLEKSLNYIQQALKHGPDYEENYLYLAEVYFAKNKLELAKKALATLDDLAKGRKNDPHVHNILKKSQELKEKIEDRIDEQDPYA